MSEVYWVACYTDVGAERKARSGIEELGRGTFTPTFTKVFSTAGKTNAYERPILNRYVMVALLGGRDDIWGAVNAVEGVHGVLAGAEGPLRVSGEEMARLMLAHATGAYNVVQYRSATGRFVSAAPPRKQKKRRRRPRSGKTYLGNHAHINAGNSYATHG